MSYVYILKLENDNYYVCYTNNLKERIAKHFKGCGCEWTKLHKPIKLLRYYKNVDKKFESMITIELMKKKYWKCVRGGGWVTIKLNNAPMCLRFTKYNNLDYYL